MFRRNCLTAVVQYIECDGAGAAIIIGAFVGGEVMA